MTDLNVQAGLLSESTQFEFPQAHAMPIAAATVRGDEQLFGTDGVAVTGLAGATGAELRYTIVVQNMPSRIAAATSSTPNSGGPILTGFMTWVLTRLG